MWGEKISTRLSVTTSSSETSCLFRALLNTEVNIRHIHLISLLRKQLMVFLQASLTMIRHILFCFRALKGFLYTHINTERHKESSIVQHMEWTPSDFVLKKKTIKKVLITGYLSGSVG